jgi:hypothetical protein
MRGFNAAQKIVTCGYAFPPFDLPFPVRECSDYRQKAARAVAGRAGVASELPVLVVSQNSAPHNTSSAVSEV